MSQDISIRVVGVADIAVLMDALRTAGFKAYQTKTKEAESAQVIFDEAEKLGVPQTPLGYQKIWDVYRCVHCNADALSIIDIRHKPDCARVVLPRLTVEQFRYLMNELDQWQVKCDPGASEEWKEAHTSGLNDARVIIKKMLPVQPPVFGSQWEDFAGLYTDEEVKRIMTQPVRWEFGGPDQWDYTCANDHQPIQMRVADGLNCPLCKIREQLPVAIQALLKDCLQRGVGQHDMVRCKICDELGHNDIFGHHYGIKHKSDCTLAVVFKEMK